MLNAALKVVEAARALSLTEANGRTKSTLEPYKLAESLSGLREALEKFDAETALSIADADLTNRPGFAAPPQLDDENADELAVNLTPQYQPSAESTLDSQKMSLNPKADNKDFIDKLLDNAVKAADLPERMLLPAYRREPTHGLNADYSDLSDTLLFDNEETVADFLIAIDRIEDKMAFALKKTGWNPRLRMLAHAMMEMRKRLVLEINHDGVFVRIPASVYSAITPAIADAIMDTDMKMIVPSLTSAPKFKPTYQEELENMYSKPKSPLQDF